MTRHHASFCPPTLVALLLAVACSGTADPVGVDRDAHDTNDATIGADMMADDASTPDATSDTGLDDAGVDTSDTVPPGDVVDTSDTVDTVDTVDTTPEACPTGRADCDGDPTNGCEVNLRSDGEHCGQCGYACPTIGGSTQFCSGGVCSVAACDPGHADCDGDPANGCEVDTDNELAHCGGCNVACALDHASPVCSAGSCAVETCDAGFEDCDGDPANGCEVEVTVDLAHCGACGNACELPDHGAPVCDAGSCAIASCDADYEDCDQSVATGCESHLPTDVAHCGACNNACPQPSHANAVCVQGACGMGSCQTGWLDVDGDDANGCEVQVVRDTAAESALARTGIVDFVIAGGPGSGSSTYASLVYTDGDEVWQVPWRNASGADRLATSDFSGARIDRAVSPTDASYVVQDGTEFFVATSTSTNGTFVVSEPEVYCTSGCASGGHGALAKVGDAWQVVVTSGSKLSWYQIAADPVSGRTCTLTDPWGLNRCAMATLTLSGITDVELMPVTYNDLVNGQFTTVTRLLLAIARSGRVDFYLLDPTDGSSTVLPFAQTGLSTQPLQLALMPGTAGAAPGLAIGYSHSGGATVLLKRFTRLNTGYPTGVVDAGSHSFSSGLASVVLDAMHALDGRHLVVSHHTNGPAGMASLVLIAGEQAQVLDTTGLSGGGWFGQLSSDPNDDRVVASLDGVLRVYQVIGLP